MDRNQYPGRSLLGLPRGNLGPQELGLLSMALPPVAGDAVGLLADGMRYAQDPSSLTPMAGLLSLAGLIPGIPASGLNKDAMRRLRASGLIKRVHNSAKLSGDNYVRGAAWAEDGALTGVHVTDNPKKVIDALNQDVPLTAGRGAEKYGDLGKGLYFSDSPKTWMGRADGPDPAQVPVMARGIFAELERNPTYSEADDLVASGLSGAFTRGGFSTVPQSVIYRNDALQRFGNWSR